MQEPIHLAKAKNILQQQEGGPIALLLGNGINRAAEINNIGWQELLESAIEKLQLTQDNPIRRLVQLNRELQDKGKRDDKKDGVAASYPELFELVRICYLAKEKASKSQTQRDTFEKEIATLVPASKPACIHKKIVGWAKNKGVPILTTNYDGCLEAALGTLDEVRGQLPKQCWPFSHQYPWGTYYAPDPTKDKWDGFAIWHIHGDQCYEKSVRATTDQYMGMAERLRPNLYEAAISKLGKREVSENLQAKPPWLGIFFERMLWIQGLGLEAHEVILRWLLLRRFHYWTKYRPGQAAASGWYMHSRAAGAMSEKTKLFLKCVGIETIELETNQQAYLDLFAET